MSAPADVRPLPAPSRRAEGWLIAGAIALSVLGDRLVLQIDTGGRGALGIVSIVAPILAAGAILAVGRSRTTHWLAAAVFVVGVLPHIALDAVLPVLGVIVNGFPVRTLYSLALATTALAFLIVGAALSEAPGRRWSRWLAVGITVQLAYAAAQALYLAHGPGWELFKPIHDWDQSYASLVGQLVEARSTGLYLNPNELGMWAGMAAILAWSLGPPRWRLVLVAMALGTLLLSQSRGAIVALVITAPIALLLGVATARIRPRALVGAMVGAVVVVAVIGAIVLAVGLPAGAFDRFTSLLNVLSQGPQADQNLTGRINYWQAVIALNAYFPWGTWGPPELLLGTAVDSSWFEAFAQGSVAAVLALALLLAAPFALLRTPLGPTLAAIAVFVALAGLTQAPFTYPAIDLFWVLFGACLQAASPVLQKARGPVVSGRWPTRSAARAARSAG